ncbi:hypothetical protein OPV22_012088 [Ensete ventricosum]|uniref:Uncharacterized protein n=1 Tax=Ensete ventricosum TaxID=4639 RepID=A0AAV8R2C5_ENSVE|nr:hypothetical protein OPV22_012088 [Ensete ventricosum]
MMRLSPRNDIDGGRHLGIIIKNSASDDRTYYKRDLELFSSSSSLPGLEPLPSQSPTGVSAKEDGRQSCTREARNRAQRNARGASGVLLLSSCVHLQTSSARLEFCLLVWCDVVNVRSIASLRSV